jgi:tetratricopeptide (TPR) repeat protein
MKSARSETIDYFAQALKLSKENHETGLSYLAQIIEKNPKDAWAYRDRAKFITFYTSDLLNKLFKTPSDFEEIKLRFTSIYLDFSAAVTLDPNNPVFYLDRGDVRVGTVFNSNPEQYEIQYGMSISSALTLAISDFNQAIKLNPNDVSTYASRGLVFRLQGKLDEAILDYTKCIDSKSHDQEDDADYHLYRGMTFFQKNKFAEAILDLVQGLEKYTKSMRSFDLYRRGSDTLTRILAGNEKRFFFLEIKTLPEEAQIKLLLQCLDQTTRLGGYFLENENIDDDNLIKEIETHLQNLIQIHIIKIQLILNAAHFDSASIFRALPLELTHCIVSKFSAATHTTAAMFTLFSNKNQSKAVEESLSIENGDTKACGLVIR